MLDEWASFIWTYTNGTYTGYDDILHQPQATKILVDLFKSELVGKEGLQYLVAWSIYRQLVEYTEPYMFLHGRPTIEVCYKHILRVMNLAIMSPFFESDAKSSLLSPKAFCCNSSTYLSTSANGTGGALKNFGLAPSCSVILTRTLFIIPRLSQKTSLNCSTKPSTEVIVFTSKNFKMVIPNASIQFLPKIFGHAPLTTNNGKVASCVPTFAVADIAPNVAHSTPE
ncbi:hypothetical protein MTO96_051718 [Rhipicephalus appendiculatus]